MAITWHEPKRLQTLEERGLDFADAELVFAGLCADVEDHRADYGEDRIITFDLLAGRLVVIVWTQRGNARHVISMRKTNEREQARYHERLG